MIKLRVVGTTDDFDKLVLSNKSRGAKGSHVVTIDKQLLDVLQEAVYSRREAKLRERAAPYAMPERIEPKVPPKEIQRQLRAGKSPKEVAAALDVSQELVERFLQPVVYERIEVINDVQDALVEKPRLGRSALPLGEAVVANIATRRVSMDQDRLVQAWAATRRDGEPWAVSFTFPFRGRSRVARWKYDPRTRSVESANALAREMGWAPKGTKRSEGAGEAAARSPRAKARGKAARAKPGAKRKPAAKKKASVKKKAVAKKKAPKRKRVAKKKTGPKKPAKRKTAGRKKPAVKRTATKRPTKRSAKAKTAKRRTLKRKTVKRAAKPARARRAPVKRSTPSRGRTSAPSRARTRGTRSARPTRRGSARRR